MISKKTIIILFSVNLALLAIVGFLLLGRAGNSAVAPRLSLQANPSSQAVAENQVGNASGDTWEKSMADRFNDPGRDSQPVTRQPPSPAPQTVQATQNTFTPPDVWPNQNLVPVAFANPDPDDPQWTPEALDRLQTLRSQFAEAAQPLQNLNPNSAEYYARWQQIRKDFDAQFSLFFGNAELLKYQQQLDRAAADAAP